jgi:hypothetical protein
MGSLNPQRVAHKVIEKAASNEIINLGEIIASVGYSKAVSEHPHTVTRTKAYKQAMAISARPLIEGLQGEINRLKEAMSTKDLTKEEYRTLIVALDVLTRNYQLLSGGATERQVFVLPSEVLERNHIEVIEDKSKDGSTKPS